MKRTGNGRVAVMLVVAWGLALTGCGEAGGGDAVTVVSSALTSTPADPVAFCRASGLHVIIGTSNNDTLNGTAAADCIVGLGGQDIINGNAGNDQIAGEDGDDVLAGDAGNDTISGGQGQDRMTGGDGSARRSRSRAGPSTTRPTTTTTPTATSTRSVCREHAFRGVADPAVIGRYLAM
jgi:Ca2+-binding RTX toxin-like protein